MNKDKAIQLLERLQDPEPYEPMLTKDAYDAIQMAIDALENQKSVCEEYCEYEDCEAEKMVVQSLSSLYPLKEFEEIAIDKVLDAVKQPKRIRGRWIPVTERPPQKDGRYYVTLENKYVKILYYAVEQTIRHPKGFYYLTEDGRMAWSQTQNPVVAWMPLPEPYKGVTE